MRNKERYAVVDLETTGASFKRGDRIIQVGIAFIENDEIVDTYASYVQPLIPVPKHITELTGITDETLKGAPLFEEIAEEIWTKIQNHIFVAHNVNFDYRFLNASLRSLGYQDLDLKRIDTVELIRAFYPTAESYKLSQFAEQNDIKLNQAHSADQDAYATAEILIRVKQKIQQFPEVFISTIRPFLPLFIHNTGEFIQRWATSERTLDDAQLTVKGPFILPVDRRNRPMFPSHFGIKEAKWDQKGQFVVANHSVTLRHEQVAMVSEVQSFYSQSTQRYFMLAADSGIGKTLSTSYGALFSLESSRRLLFVTTTHLLIEQYLSVTLPMLTELLGRPVRFAVLKSAENYLDLEAYQYLLQAMLSNIDQVSKSEAMITVAILVWLSETQTGDLDELNHGLMTVGYWEKYDRFNKKNVATVAKWGEYAYYDYEKEKSKSADIVLTNQAYFIQHESELRAQYILTDDTAVIIDECHRLPENVLEQSTTTLSTLTIRQCLNQVDQMLMTVSEFLFNRSGEKESYTWYYEWQINAQRLWESYETLMADLDNVITFSVSQHGQKRQAVLTDPLDNKNKWAMSLKSIREGIQQHKILSQRLIHPIQYQEWLSQDQQQILDQQLFEELEHTLNTLILNSEATYVEIEEDKEDYRITRAPYDSGQVTRRFLEQLPSHTILMSASLALLKKENLLSHTFGIKDYHYCFFESPFDFKKQVQAYLVEDQRSFDKMNELQSAEILFRLVQILQKERPAQIQIIFQSRQLLESTYSLFKERSTSAQLSHVYAQTQFKYLKKMAIQFSEDDEGVLLGMVNFSEGIHFNRNSDYYILTRLPFAAPRAPREIAMDLYYQKQQQSYFYQRALPNMLLRLTQIIGRLLNSKKEQTVWICLDKRIVTSSYQHWIQKALPIGLKFHSLPLEYFAHLNNNKERFASKQKEDKKSFTERTDEKQNF